MSNEENKSTQNRPENFMLGILQAAKAGELDQLNKESKQLAEIMLDHEDEYGEEYETLLNGDTSSDPDLEQSPFLHITIHAAIENQLKEKNPIEVYQFFNAMINKKIPRHESIHLVGCILAHLMYDVMVEHKPFDTERYIFLLKRYKSKKPASIYAAMEKGFQ